MPTECQRCDAYPVPDAESNFYRQKGYGLVSVCDDCVSKDTYEKQPLSSIIVEGNYKTATQEAPKLFYSGDIVFYPNTQLNAKGAKRARDIINQARYVREDYNRHTFEQHINNMNPTYLIDPTNALYSLGVNWRATLGDYIPPIPQQYRGEIVNKYDLEEYGDMMKGAKRCLETNPPYQRRYNYEGAIRYLIAGTYYLSRAFGNDAKSPFVPNGYATRDILRDNAIGSDSPTQNDPDFDPEKADRNKDGEISDWERAVGNAVAKGIREHKEKKGAETFEAKGYKGISSSKIQVLEKYIENGGQALNYHELPYHIQRQLEMGKVHELLYQDVNRWLQDNAPNPHHAMPSWLSAEEGKVRTMSGKPHTPRKLIKDQNIKPEEARMRKQMKAEEYKHCDGCEEVRSIEEFSLSNDPEQTLTEGEVCDYCFGDFYDAESFEAQSKGKSKCSKHYWDLAVRRNPISGERQFFNQCLLCGKKNFSRGGSAMSDRGFFAEGGSMCEGKRLKDSGYCDLDFDYSSSGLYAQCSDCGNEEFQDEYWDSQRISYTEPDEGQVLCAVKEGGSEDDLGYCSFDWGWGSGNAYASCDVCGTEVDATFDNQFYDDDDDEDFDAQSYQVREGFDTCETCGDSPLFVSTQIAGGTYCMDCANRVWRAEGHAENWEYDFINKQIETGDRDDEMNHRIVGRNINEKDGELIVSLHNNFQRKDGFDAESPFSSDAFNEGRSAGITMFIPEGDAEDYYSNLDTEYMIFYGLSPEDLAKDIDGNSKRYLQFVAGWDDGWNYATLLHEGVFDDDSDSEGDLEDLDYEMAGEWIYQDFPEGLREYVPSAKELGAEVAVLGGIVALGLGYFVFKDKIGFKGETFRATESCSEDKDCPDGKVCVDGKCLPICVDDGDCASWRECRDDLHPTEKVCGEDKTDSTENPFSDFVKREENQVDEPTEPNATEGDTYSTTTKALIGVGIVGAIGVGIKVLGGMQDKGDE